MADLATWLKDVGAQVVSVADDVRAGVLATDRILNPTIIPPVTVQGSPTAVNAAANASPPVTAAKSNDATQTMMIVLILVVMFVFMRK